VNLSPNFTLAEATKSQTAERQGIDNTPPPHVIENMKMVAQAILEPVRAHFKRPVFVNSWYRSPALNKAVGGVDRPGRVSQHVTGHAVDFEIPGVPNAEVAAFVRDNLIFDQVILEFYRPGVPDSGWVHASFVADGQCRAECLTVNASGTFQGLLA
jgi:zinc D-Ala-D-Ala carboxypeptidase